MPEEKDVNKKVYPVKKPGKTENIYEGIESHYESERNEGPEEGPTAPMSDREGPIVLSQSTYTGEDDEWFEREKRKPKEEKK